MSILPCCASWVWKSKARPGNWRQLDFSSSFVSAKALTANSRSSRECAAETWVRTRAVLDGETALGQRRAKIFCVLFKFVAQFRRCAEKFERFQRRGYNWRRNRV